MNANVKRQLILNPTENLPDLLYTPSPSYSQGLYIDELLESETIQKTKTVLFSGHNILQQDIADSQERWRKLLGADHISLRLLSGLHAHTVTFMGIGKIGDTVLLLPSEAGGHNSAKKILQRLGYHVIDMAVNYESRSIDMPSTVEIIQQKQPEFIFVDQSDSLNYEDFSSLTKVSNTCNIFDASQYLTHIISQQYKSPFQMGFQIILSSLHKNFPGPQKALICSKGGEKYWDQLIGAINTYVSSAHPANIIHAGELIRDHLEYIRLYGTLMLQNTNVLERELMKYRIPVIERNPDLPATQQIWIPCASSDEAYRFFRTFEHYNILLNYRKLAYHLGYGLRLGTAAATLSGLRPAQCEQLAYYFQAIYHGNIPTGFQRELQNFIDSIWEGGEKCHARLS